MAKRREREREGEGARPQRKDEEVAQGDVLLQVMQHLSATGCARWPSFVEDTPYHLLGAVSRSP